MKKVMLTTGGTGGHIYPALAVADKLKLKGVDTVFVEVQSVWKKI